MSRQPVNLAVLEDGVVEAGVESSFAVVVAVVSVITGAVVEASPGNGRSPQSTFQA